MEETPFSSYVRTVWKSWTSKLCLVVCRLVVLFYFMSEKYETENYFRIIRLAIAN